MEMNGGFLFLPPSRRGGLAKAESGSGGWLEVRAVLSQPCGLGGSAQSDTPQLCRLCRDIWLGHTCPSG